MEIVKVKNYDALSLKACELIMAEVNNKEKPVLGLATGSTPEGLYRLLIAECKDGGVSFAKATTFNLDEYVGLPVENSNSYDYYMHEKLFDHIDLPESRAFLPSGNVADLQKECHDYEETIRGAGNIDVQILGLGLNGHIGFNEPGTSFESQTHVVDLDESTRQANSRFFNSMNEVPTQAITMGIGTIMESEKIILLVSGEKKADAVARLVQGDVTEEFPASILQNHENVILIADEGALSKL